MCELSDASQQSTGHLYRLKLGIGRLHFLIITDLICLLYLPIVPATLQMSVQLTADNSNWSVTVLRLPRYIEYDHFYTSSSQKNPGLKRPGRPHIGA